MNRTRQWAAVVCYILAAAALVFYLHTLYQGTHTQVSPEYQSYYLDQELYTWPGSGGLAIQRGQTIHFDSLAGGDSHGVNHLLQDSSSYRSALIGWTYAENQGYQITGWDAPMLFFGEPGQTYHGSITLLPPESGGRVDVLVNGELTAFADLLQDSVTVEFDTPALPDDGRMTLELVLEGDARTPVSVKELILT